MPTPDTCGAGSIANELLTELLGDKVFPIPQIDLSTADFVIPPSSGSIEASKIELKDLTEKKIDGKGSFDVLMAASLNHIREEFDKDRITGHEYAQAYMQIMQGVMATALQFTLGKDQAYWQARTAEIQARIAEAQVVQARIEAETAKANLAMMQYRALLAETEYATAKIRLAVEDMNLCIAKEQLRNLELEGDTKSYNLLSILPKQSELLDGQIEGVGLDNDTKTYTNEEILPIQKKLTEEQLEVQRAQTMDTRTDGTTPITGSVGKQKDLYTQQIKSYQDDSKTKAAKISSDAWITMRTMDEGYPSPDVFNNDNIHTTLSDLMTSVGLPTPID